MAQQKQQIDRISSLRLIDASPRVIDGDTLEVPGSKVRIIGIDAPDDELQQLKQLSAHMIEGLVERDDGVQCATSCLMSRSAGTAVPCPSDEL
ncbi:hypothetical protein [Sphingobium sp. EP60837]|uniref:hypothetical protein n=1 Tax=Sphingobium sp. EP60837 TaxID=1855519 RepID=UPI000829C35E|nr:hypothetical protein [Sphingobium sp. EP60837]